MSDFLVPDGVDLKSFLWLSETDCLKILAAKGLDEKSVGVGANRAKAELRRVAAEIDKCSPELPYFTSLLLRYVTEGEWEVTAPKKGTHATWEDFDDFMGRIREYSTLVEEENAKEAEADPEFYARIEGDLRATQAKVERLLRSTPYEIFLFREFVLRAVAEEVEYILRDIIDGNGPFERQLTTAAEGAADRFSEQWEKDHGFTKSEKKP